MKKIAELRNNEWLEADGLGGFASDSVSSMRTRRYHVLLLTATQRRRRRTSPLDAARLALAGTR